MKTQPYLVVPNLIEQPTWGGHYISDHKQLKQKELKNKKIGQSYELYQHTNLSTKTSTKNLPTIEMGDSKTPQKAKSYSKNDQPFSINQLIKLDPVKVLGKRSIKLFGPQIKTLIKYTQAKGNSYQIHVKKKTDKWLPKPESWYYLEPGLVTLGVKSTTDWQQYQLTCQKINQLAIELSLQIKTNKISLELARTELKSFIKNNNPKQFVNLVKVKAGQAIDLSDCGIHHSWEQDQKYAPHGNIVYEVQENVYDQESTIRSFDKGKIKDDGSIRELQIKDYFKHVDRSARANSPRTHLIKTTYLKKTKNFSIQQIFKSKKYSMQQINFNHQFTDQTHDSFHHLFVKQGQLNLTTQNTKLIISAGFSVFIPAATQQYLLTSIANPGNSSSDAQVLKTYI